MLSSQAPSRFEPESALDKKTIKLLILLIFLEISNATQAKLQLVLAENIFHPTLWIT